MENVELIMAVGAAAACDDDDVGKRYNRIVWCVCVFVCVWGKW